MEKEIKKPNIKRKRGSFVNKTDLIFMKSGCYNRWGNTSEEPWPFLAQEPKSGKPIVVYEIVGSKEIACRERIKKALKIK